MPSRRTPPPGSATEREFFVDNLLVRIHCIIVMIRWNGLAPWKFESPFPGSLNPQPSTLNQVAQHAAAHARRGAQRLNPKP